MSEKEERDRVMIAVARMQDALTNAELKAAHQRSLACVEGPSPGPGPGKMAPCATHPGNPFVGCEGRNRALETWTCGKCKNEFGASVTKWNCCPKHSSLAPLCAPCAFELHPDDLSIQQPEKVAAFPVKIVGPDLLLETRITRQFVCIANNCRRKDEVREIRAIALGNEFYGIPFSIICGSCGSHAVQVQLDDWSG